MTQTIKVTCPGCDKTIKAGEKYWGKKVKCPQCAETLKVSSPQSHSSGGSAVITRKRSASTKKRRKSSRKKTDDFDSDDLGNWNLSEKDLQHFDDGTDTFEEDVYESRGVSPANRRKKRSKKKKQNRSAAGGAILIGIGVLVFGILLAIGFFVYLQTK